MNVFIHQNNATAGPFDEVTLKEMLDSGQVLPLTFACLEGESSWRPVFEIVSLLEKAAPPAPVSMLAPPPLRRPAPVVQNQPPREETFTSPVVTGPRAIASAAMEVKTLSSLKIACPKCGQHILVDASMAGMTGVCPTCGGAVPIPAFATIPQSTPPRSENSSVLGRAKGFAFRFTGLQPLPEFKISHLFSDVFKNRSRQDFDSLFNCGTPTTTPEPTKPVADLPRPWFYLRMLIIGGLLLLAFCRGFEKFPDPKLFPGLMIMGAFLVPLSCVALFFELNIPRNVSAYQVAKLIVGGAILSLPVTLFISAHTKPGFAWTLCAAMAGEIAQALIAVALLCNPAHYKWILNGLLAGAAVGAGFAGIDGASYFFYALVDDMGRADGKIAPFYSILADHAGFTPFCQVVWTAIITGALWRAKGDGPFRVSLFFRGQFLRIFIPLVVLQALQNTGLLWTKI